MTQKIINPSIIAADMKKNLAGHGIESRIEKAGNSQTVYLKCLYMGDYFRIRISNHPVMNVSEYQIDFDAGYHAAANGPPEEAIRFVLKKCRLDVHPKPIFTDKPVNVRVAEMRDEDKVFSLMHLAHQENAVAPVNHQKVWEKIHHATRRKGGIIGVIDGVKGIEAMICMTLSQWWYSDDWHIEELCNFVHPAHRVGDHAKNLLQFSKWFSEQMNLPLFIGVLSTHRVEAKVRLYERQITKGGAVFCHNLNKEYIHG